MVTYCDEQAAHERSGSNDNLFLPFVGQRIDKTVLSHLPEGLLEVVSLFIQQHLDGAGTARLTGDRLSIALSLYVTSLGFLTQ